MGINLRILNSIERGNRIVWICGGRYGKRLVGHHIVKGVKYIRLAEAVKEPWEIFAS